MIRHLLPSISVDMASRTSSWTLPDLPDEFCNMDSRAVITESEICGASSGVTLRRTLCKTRIVSVKTETWNYCADLSFKQLSLRTCNINHTFNSEFLHWWHLKLCLWNLPQWDLQLMVISLTHFLYFYLYICICSHAPWSSLCSRFTLI